MFRALEPMFFLAGCDCSGSDVSPQSAASCEEDEADANRWNEWIRNGSRCRLPGGHQRMLDTLHPYISDGIVFCANAH